MVPQPSTSSERAAPATHSQPSRKGKKAWRKNVDITEVTTGLENLRDEIRTTGGQAIAEQSNDQLFATDTAGDEGIRRRHKLTKPLKVDEILAQRSAVPAVDVRKRKSNALLGDGIYDSSSSSKKRKEGWVAKKEVQRLRAKINTQNLLDQEDIVGGGAASDAQFDLWANPAPSVPAAALEKSEMTTTTPKEEQNEYIPQAKPKVAPPTIHRAPIPMTASGKPAKPVANPDAGTSYNPSFDSWAALLERQGEKEVAAEEARLAKAKAEAERQARIAEIAAKPDDDVGYDTGIESAWEGFESESDGEALSQGLKKKRPGRKTPQQRKRAERRKQQERLAKHEAAMGRKQKQSEQAIMALIKATTAKDQELVQENPEGQEQEIEEEYTTVDAPLRRRRLGPTTIPEPQLEVVLPDELQDSLRRLKPEGNLMNDRFRTLLVNGKIEARKRVLQPRKRKVKVTEKWSYKDFELPRIKA